MPNFKIKERDGGILCWAFLLAIWVFLHHRVLWGGQTFVMMDGSGFFYPLWKWGAEIWNKGLLPLWNPDTGFGTPYFQDPQNIAWYPPKLLLYAGFDPTTAFNCLILGHYFWALVGFWCLMRCKGYSSLAAFGGCLAFGFSFNAICLSWSTTMVFTYSWIPWVFLAAQRVWEREKGSFLWFSLVCGMQIAAGYPLAAYLTFLMLGLERAFELLREPLSSRRFRDWGKRAAWLGGGLVLGAALNAAWILPLAEFTRYSNLQKRLELSWPVDWAGLATWLNPFYLGHPLHSSNTLFMFTVYFAGLPLVVLVLWALLARKADPRRAILFTFLLVLSLGETAKLGGWLKEFLPGYRWVVRSGYWLPMVLFILCLWTVEIAKEFMGEAEKGRRGPWVLSVVIVYGGALLLGVPWDLASFWISMALTLLAGEAGRFPLNLRWFFLWAGLAFSLVPAVRSIDFTMDRRIYDEKPPLCSAFTQPGRIYHSPLVVDQYRVVAGNGVADVYQKIQQALIPNWPLTHGLEECCFTNTIFLKDFLAWYYEPLLAPSSETKKLLDYLHVRYVLGMDLGHALKPVPMDLPVTLGEDDGLLPKWFCVSEALPAGGWPEDKQKLEAPGFDLSRACLLQGVSGPSSFALRQVVETSRTPGRIELKANEGGTALVVSSEMAYPGWRVKEGGKILAPERVNDGFRGLVLAAGLDQATVYYDPATFRMGCFVSLLAMGFLFFIFLKGIRGRLYA